MYYCMTGKIKVRQLFIQFEGSFEFITLVCLNSSEESYRIVSNSLSRIRGARSWEEYKKVTIDILARFGMYYVDFSKEYKKI